MQLEDIIYTEEQIKEMGYNIENNIIEEAEVKVIGHFGNTPSLNVWCNNCRIFGDYNNAINLGSILKALVELFDLTNEDGYRFFSKFKNIPCRIITDGTGGWGSKCVGFGHFMKDKFVLTEELATFRCGY